MNDLHDATAVWKTFDENVVTHSSAHHLMAIRELLQHYGYARVTDVAKHLGITRGSASVTLKALKEKGYATEDANKFLRLTASGKRIVQTIEANREVLQKFFRDVLAANHEQAEIDACKLEHLLSSEIGKRLLDFLDFLFSEDHRAAAFLAAFQTLKQTN
jgi:Mn-dependent DtxR family transcriptional regulator